MNQIEAQISRMKSAGLLRKVGINREIRHGFKSISIYEDTQLPHEFKRFFALVENNQGDKAAIFCFHEEFSAKRMPLDSDEIFFGRHSILSRVEVYTPPDKKNLFNYAASANLRSALKARDAGNKTKLKSDQNIQLGAGNVRVVFDPKNKESNGSSSLQKAIGSLFSKKGPFNKFVFVSNENQRDLEDNLREGGTEFLLDSNHLEMFNGIVRELIPSTDTREQLGHIIDSLMAKTALQMHLKEGDGETDWMGLERDELLQYLKKEFDNLLVTA